MSDSNKTNSARQEVVDYLLNEIWGPTQTLPTDAKPLPAPEADGIIRFPKDEQDVKYFDPETNELLVQGIRPQVQYGTGVLHSPDVNKLATSPVETVDEIPLPDLDVPDIKVDNHIPDGADDGEESFSLDQSQKLRPSAFGLTFRVPAEETSADSLEIKFAGAIYEQVQVQFESYGKTTWYKRKALSGSSKININDLLANLEVLQSLSVEGDASSYISLMARSRIVHLGGKKCLSVTVVAKHKGAAEAPEDVLQAGLEVTYEGTDRFVANAQPKDTDDDEMAEINFIYRHVKDYATGHGISVEWDESANAEAPKQIRTVAIPKFYQEVLSFNSLSENFAMDKLSEMQADELQGKLGTIVEAYKSWIKAEKEKLGSDFATLDAAQRLVAKAEHLAQRMQQGLEALFAPENGKMLEAFRDANMAMYLQQKHGKRLRRQWSEKTATDSALRFGPVIEGDPSKFGKWRPFQIGFLLLSVNGLLSPEHEDREEVDLIFFPTGGGKTEAYLGASALTIIYRRLTGQDSSPGVDVLMRYTLRLLTIQQFERSSGLITALEHMRRADPQRLGEKPISIGVWLGSSTTPNYRQEAVDLHKKGLGKYEDTNPFVLSKCPWCGAGFGWDKKRDMWIGYSVLGKPKQLRFKCFDPACDFYSDEEPLPIWITDEDVYNEKPSFILGTVDKFARMAWVPEARALFNLNSAGERVGAPPALIIQDELHLISGPLGSMVGLYEPVIEELCTDRRGETPIRPKIIASTATTRKYESQIFGLYGREKISLFPQAITRANETFFSKVERGDDGLPTKGTLYVGVNPSTYETGQMAASVVAAVLLQAPNQRAEEDPEMDYYRTSMWFFNSLRELGMTLTLMQSVVLDKIRGMSLYRRLPSGSKPRWPSTIMELTSRVHSNQIKSSLDDLGKKSTEQGSVSTCLASSIMEVGVDVTRLGLLTIMSQPKSTAQYIQVSGRVGRDGPSGPGLVVMLYNAQRARDRSVYERFGSYHSRLYAQVEPVSVTPFSIPAMRHGLVGALLSFYRMTSQVDQDSIRPVESIISEAEEVLLARLQGQATDAEKVSDFQSQIREFVSHWKRYQPGRWKYSPDEEKGKIPDEPAPALMRARREALLDYAGDESVLVPSSLRSVDGQTEIKISHNPYAFFTEGEDN